MLVNLPNDVVERVLNMLALGVGKTKIANLLDVPKSMVTAISDETPKEVLAARRRRLGNRTNRSSLSQ